MVYVNTLIRPEFEMKHIVHYWIKEMIFFRNPDYGWDGTNGYNLLCNRLWLVLCMWTHSARLRYVRFSLHFKSRVSVSSDKQLKCNNGICTQPVLIVSKASAFDIFLNLLTNYELTKYLSILWNQKLQWSSNNDTPDNHELFLTIHHNDWNIQDKFKDTLSI